MGAPKAALARTAGGDDYPYPNSKINEANNPLDPERVDPWKFFNRECTSFVAWRMNRDAGTPRSPYLFSNNMYGGHWGNACDWARNAERLGYPVDHIPEVGAIVHFGPFEGGAKRLGHVSYVEEVNADGTVNISEYCWATRCGYGTRRNVRAPRFIHLKKFKVGDPVQVSSSVNVRESPGSSSAIARVRNKGESGTVVEGPVLAVQHGSPALYRFYKIRWDNSDTGWSVEFPIQKR